MKVAWSVLIGDARGTTGTVSASKGYAGTTIRAHAIPSQPNSVAQLLARANLATMAQFWRAPAMATYRAGWVILAIAHPELDVFSYPIKKSGMQWFVRCNRNRQTVGLPVLLTAPAFAAVANPGVISLSMDGPPATYLEVTPTTPLASGDSAVIAASRCLSPGLLTFSNTTRILKTITGPDAGPWNFLTDHTAKFGNPISALQIFVEVHYVNDAQGRAGLPGTSSIVVP